MSDIILPNGSSGNERSGGCTMPMLEVEGNFAGTYKSVNSRGIWLNHVPAKRTREATSKFRKHISQLFNSHTLPVIATFTELSLITLASFSAGTAYHHYYLGHISNTQFYFFAVIALSTVFCLTCGYNRDYSVSRLPKLREQIHSVFLRWNSAFLISLFALFMSYATEFYSRGAIICQYIAGLAAAVGFRLALGYVVSIALEKRLLGGKRILVAGDRAGLSSVTRQLAENSAVEVVGTIAFDYAADVSRQAASVKTDKSTREAIEQFVRQHPVDEVVLSLPWSERGRIRQVVDELAILPTTLHLAPDANAQWVNDLRPASVGTLPTMKLLPAALTLRDRIVKRSFDLVASTLLLLAALPTFAFIAMLIKLDSKGPVFFRQRRHGFNQGEFRIFKFRTMTTLDDGNEIRQATRGDKRITRVGSFLRRTNLDELPQLLNVLLGHMSLVGPRPHAIAHNTEFEEKIQMYARRHNVKPGITGWSQINGYRGETNTIDKMEKRVECDLFYIDNWSILFDVTILFSTVISPKSYKNAY